MTRPLRLALVLALAGALSIGCGEKQRGEARLDDKPAAENTSNDKADDDSKADDDKADDKADDDKAEAKDDDAKAEAKDDAKAEAKDDAKAEAKDDDAKADDAAAAAEATAKAAAAGDKAAKVDKKAAEAAIRANTDDMVKNVILGNLDGLMAHYHKDFIDTTAGDEDTNYAQMRENMGELLKQKPTITMNYIVEDVQVGDALAVVRFTTTYAVQLTGRAKVMGKDRGFDVWKRSGDAWKLYRSLQFEDKAPRGQVRFNPDVAPKMSKEALANPQVKEVYDAELAAYAAITTNNLDAYLELLSDDLVTMSPGAEDDSRASLTKTYKEMFARNPTNTAKFGPEEILVSGDIAVVKFINAYKLVAGTDKAESTDRGFDIWRKEDGKWRLLSWGQYPFVLKKPKKGAAKNSGRIGSAWSYEGPADEVAVEDYGDGEGRADVLDGWDPDDQGGGDEGGTEDYGDDPEGRGSIAEDMEDMEE